MMLLTSAALNLLSGVILYVFSVMAAALGRAECVDEDACSRLPTGQEKQVITKFPFCGGIFGAGMNKLEALELLLQRRSSMML